MAKSLVNSNTKFGAMSVFLTALSTIFKRIIIFRHNDWEKGQIKIFALYPDESIEEKRKQLLGLIKTGRLPISQSNISVVPFETGNRKQVIMKYSPDANLTLIGFTSEILKNIEKLSEGYQDLGNILFVSYNIAKAIN